MEAVRNIKSVAKINQKCNLRLLEKLINIVTILEMHKITIIHCPKWLSLFFYASKLLNIEGAVLQTDKTIIAYILANLPF